VQLVRLRVVNSETNLGHNANDHAVALASAPPIIELDDDVIEAPQGWDAALAIAYEAVPKIGYLAADLAHDPNDATSTAMYGKNAGLYRSERIAGHQLRQGPVGGWCAITDRALYDRVGGFGQNSNWVFWSEDAHYIKKIAGVGFDAALLASVRVHHAGGTFYSPLLDEKVAWWRD
jgi:hypothetical protein